MRTAVTIDQIDACLPQTQCTQCGYPRCRAYAEALADGAAGINQCPPGNEITIQALATLLHLPPKPLNPQYGEHKPRARAVIDETLCIGCRKCIDACPVDAIVGARKLMHTVIVNECTGCELCLPPCPVDCIAMVSVDVPHSGEPWPEYTRAETARWRARTEKRLERLARNKSARQGKAMHMAGSTTPLPNDREKIRAEIRAAVERVKAKRKNRQGEAGLSTMPLTGIGAAERPHTDVRAGVNRNSGGDAKEGMPADPRATKTSKKSDPA